MSLLAKYFKGFPEKQALKGTLATVVAYKGSKYISNMIGESMSKTDATKKEMWEFIGSAGAVLGSMFAYTKIKSYWFWSGSWFRRERSRQIDVTPCNQKKYS